MTPLAKASEPLSPQVLSAVDDHRYLKQWVGLVSIWLFVVVVLGLGLLSQREKVGSIERDRLGTQARVIEENLTRQLRGANAALAGVRYDLSSGDRDPKQNIAPLRLKVLSDAMPGVRAMVVMNPLGVIVDADRHDLVGRNYSDSQTFRVPAAEADTTKLYVSPPFKSPLSGFTISLGKVMRGTDNRFSGLVIATLDPAYFDTLMGSVFYAPDMAAAIVHGDGKVVVVMPANPALLALNVDTPGSLFRRHQEGGQAVNLYEGTGTVDNPQEDRMVAVRTLQPPDLFMNKPLIISVSRLRSEVYAPWYAEVTTTVVLALGICISSVLMLYYTQRRHRALAVINASVRRLQEDSARRFEFGLEGADLGLWDWEMDHDRLTINGREAAMLGFDRDATLHSAKVWQRLIHPDDWPQVRARFKELLDGESESYKLEHRMLRLDGQPVWVLSQAMVMERAQDGRVTRILGTHLDVSTRKEAENALGQTLKRLELAMKCGSIGLMDWDVASGALVLNALAWQILGIGEQENVTATHWRALCHPEDGPQAEAALQRLLSEKDFDYNLEYRVRHARGRYVWLNVRAEVVEWNADGAPKRLMVTFRDISARIAAELNLRFVNEQLAELSITDALTGIGNRRRFDQALAAEWARGARNRQPISLLLIDIDYFKRYNDRYGHQEGDMCLRQVATILSQCVRRPDELLARYGGEEFAVLLYGSGIDAAVKLAQRCVNSVRHAAIPHEASSVAACVTLSIGVHSVVPVPGSNSDALVKAADEALYQAKGSGRARVCSALG